MITKEQFLRDAAVGWKGRDLVRHSYFCNGDGHVIHGIRLNNPGSVVACCAIGAAALGSGTNSWYHYERGLNPRLVQAITDINNDPKNKTKSDILGKIANLNWSSQSS